MSSGYTNDQEVVSEVPAQDQKSSSFLSTTSAEFEDNALEKRSSSAPSVDSIRQRNTNDSGSPSRANEQPSSGSSLVDATTDVSHLAAVYNPKSQPSFPNSPIRSQESDTAAVDADFDAERDRRSFESSKPQHGRPESAHAYPRIVARRPDQDFLPYVHRSLRIQRAIRARAARAASRMANTRVGRTAEIPSAPLPPWEIAKPSTSGSGSLNDKAVDAAVSVPVADTTDRAVNATPSTSAATTPSPDPPASLMTPRLTHVSSTGKARMVDVGQKPSTHRIAIAVSCVSFKNHEALRLIMENTNKKGDVLGVARIAGIMAAKRCSDIIPLCHPLAISKVTVDLQPLPSGTLHMNPTRNEYGAVAVEARVECHGPTGVEMEALTAATGAALTVYDMCKAVDRKMVITGTRVVFKDGGKSGRYVHKGWVREKRKLGDVDILKDLGLDGV